MMNVSSETLFFMANSDPLWISTYEYIQTNSDPGYVFGLVLPNDLPSTIKDAVFSKSDSVTCKSE